MFAAPVQIPRKGEGDMEGLSPAWQASTRGYRSILEQAYDLIIGSLLFERQLEQITGTKDNTIIFNK